MTINCKGKLIDLSVPKVMGILNITPDSFYDGGRYENETDILRRTEKMLNEGAAFIDVGAYSSRPGAEHVSEEEELRRVVPVIALLVKHFPEILISVDTFRAVVAKACIQEGAAIINDIASGNLDKNMISTVAELQVPYIMMHMKGTPQNMQQDPQYKDITKEVLYYFSEKVAGARKAGINDLIIDPGFGFAKTLAHNYELMSKLELLHHLELPLLVGISRKSMIYKLLKNRPKDALNGTTALNTIALSKGAHILRVHDVKEAVECVKLVEQLQGE
ncbi:dihydropteroate synthase [Sinomicrobium weinanense]|uniref:Dihydropteroate synthase n=1 Tax=Sinomicrobium weinanense TaxID=2842200 RepID=A0A926JT72_9FLAO|nr:dihydropteroate synthase [Sinomicrobium weinanense]MBC9797053.1 dihydropteroate synthase [Sinomicrobium weinanense]MBU3122048.1 dihydropteroate synthase [Sinomicrobium weinanense]